MTIPYWLEEFFILDGWAYYLTRNCKTVRMKEEDALKVVNK